MTTSSTKSIVSHYDKLLSDTDSESKRANDETQSTSRRPSTSLLFDKFYEENKNLLKMDASDTYPRNESAIHELVERAKHENDIAAVQMADLVSFALTHIGFSEFYQTLCKNAYELSKVCDEQNKKIHLVIYGDVSKSNVWCSLLVWPIVRPYVVGVSGTTDIPSGISAKSDIMLLLVDDAIYSGKQMHGALTAIQSNTQLLYKQTNNDKNVVDDWETAPVNVGVLVCATTKHGRAKVASVSPLVRFIGSYTKDIFTLDESLKELHPKRAATIERNIMETRWFTTIESIANFNFDVTLTYFDHKMPDSLSTNDHFLAAVPFPAEESEDWVTVRSLITRCPKSDFFGISSGYVEMSQREAAGLSRQLGGKCPPAFYKTIAYKVNGEAVSSNRVNIDDVLKMYVSSN